MRILQVNTSDFYGGVVAYDLLQAYRTHGHLAWLAVGYKRSSDPDVLPMQTTQIDDYYNGWNRWARARRDIENMLPLFRRVPNVRHVIRGFRRGFRQPLSQLDSLIGREDFRYPGTWHLLELTPERPDILHCHNLHGGYFDMRALPWLSQQMPVVLTLNDAWLLSGHCAHSFECERWRTGCGNCPDLTIYPPIRRDATAYNWQRKRDIYTRCRFHIRAPSNWLLEKAKQSMLMHAAVTFHVIPNGVDMTVFRRVNQTEARRALGLPDNAKIILLIAHNQFKDYVMMESALGRLFKSNDADLMFICLGRSGASKTIGQGYMVYQGYEGNQQRMALYYSASDVYIHAAKDEAFGKTITEAMFCGVPVVATEVGGIPEQIEDNISGFLTPSGDAGAMAARVQQLLSDGDLGKRLAASAEEFARQHFSFSKQAELYLDCYDEILNTQYSEYRTGH